MTKRDTLSLAMKIIGIYFIIQGILSIIGTPLYLLITYEKSTINVLVMTFSFGLLNLIIGYLTIKYAEKLSQKFIAEDKELQVSGAGGWQKEVFIIALKIIGVYLLVTWLPTIIGIVGQYFYGETKSLDAPILLSVIRIVLMLGVNLYLILGAEHLAGLIYRKKDM